MLLWNSHSMDGLAAVLGLLAAAVCLGLVYGGVRMLRNLPASASARIVEGVLGVLIVGIGLVAGLVVVFCLLWVNS